MRKLTGMILSTAVLVSSVSFSVANAADIAKLDAAKPSTAVIKQDSKETQKTAAVVNDKAADSKQTKVAENTQAVAKPAIATAKETPKTEVKAAVKADAKTEAKSGVAAHKPATTGTQVKQPS